jgi:hypothetical protein
MNDYAPEQYNSLITSGRNLHPKLSGPACSPA